MACFALACFLDYLQMVALQQTHIDRGVMGKQYRDGGPVLGTINQICGITIALYTGSPSTERYLAERRTT